EIALVALGVLRSVKLEAPQARPAPDIMTGSERRGAELLRGLQQILELDLLVADHARHRRLAGKIAVGELAHDSLGEPRLVIEDIVRNAERLRHVSGILDILAGATGPLATDRFAMIVHLKRDADHVVALAFQKGRDHGGINP